MRNAIAEPSDGIRMRRRLDGSVDGTAPPGSGSGQPSRAASWTSASWCQNVSSLYCDGDTRWIDTSDAEHDLAAAVNESISAPASGSPNPRILIVSTNCRRYRNASESTSAA